MTNMRQVIVIRFMSRANMTHRITNSFMITITHAVVMIVPIRATTRGRHRQVNRARTHNRMGHILNNSIIRFTITRRIQFQHTRHPTNIMQTMLFTNIIMCTLTSTSRRFVNSTRNISQTTNVNIRHDLFFILSQLMGNIFRQTIVTQRMTTKRRPIRNQDKANNIGFPTIIRLVLSVTRRHISTRFLIFPVNTKVNQAQRIRIVTINTSQRTTPRRVNLVFLAQRTRTNNNTITRVDFSSTMRRTIVTFFLITRTINILVKASRSPTRNTTIIR